VTITNVTLAPCARQPIGVRTDIPANTPRNISDTLTLDVQAASNAATQTRTLISKTPATVLLVDDDRWYDIDPAYQAALRVNGVSFDKFDTRGYAGPPLALFFNNQELSKNEFRAALAIFRVIESASTLAAYDTLHERGWQRLSPFTVPMLMPNGPAAHVGLELGAAAGILVERGRFLGCFLCQRVLQEAGVVNFEVCLGPVHQLLQQWSGEARFLAFLRFVHVGTVAAIQTKPGA